MEVKRKELGQKLTSLLGQIGYLKTIKKAELLEIVIEEPEYFRGSYGATMFGGRKTYFYSPLMDFAVIIGHANNSKLPEICEGEDLKSLKSILYEGIIKSPCSGQTKLEIDVLDLENPANQEVFTNMVFTKARYDEYQLRRKKLGNAISIIETK